MTVTNGKVLLSDIRLYCNQPKTEGLVKKDGDTIICCPVGPDGSILAPGGGGWSPDAVYLCWPQEEKESKLEEGGFASIFRSVGIKKEKLDDDISFTCLVTAEESKKMKQNKLGLPVQLVDVGDDREQARKLGRCDSYLQNLKTLLTDPLTDRGRC